MNKYQSLYSKFIKANEGKLHFACHSHHYWPDCTREAQLEYWDDSCKMIDNKWEYILTQKATQAQKLLSDHLNFNRPKDITFAPNTHELVTRILSSFTKKIKLLTTDSEFYSFSRQLNRYIEEDLVEVTIVPTLPIETFQERFIEASGKGFDVVFTSHVFFNSGLAIEDLNLLVEEVSKNSSTIIIDGYHGFMALPVDLSKIGDKIFYIAGSYKYVGAGEGCCFMTIPKDCKLRPLNTGWFAEVSSLENVNENSVAYPKDGMRFAGSTLDYTSLYRLVSVLELFKNEKINSSLIHKHVQSCQKRFLELIDKLNHPHLNRGNLLINKIDHHGHFLTFDLESTEIVDSIRKSLESNDVLTDSRKNRLRFGFAIYHDSSEYTLDRFKI